MLDHYRIEYAFMKTKVQISRDCLVLFSEIKEVVEAHVREIIGTIFELYVLTFLFNSTFLDISGVFSFLTCIVYVITKITIDIVF